MDSGAMAWIAIIFIVVGMPIYLDHKQKMAKLLGHKSDPDEKLLARIDALEKKCEKLQEQVTEAHALLVDERRMLDQKLAQKLAESANGSAAIPNTAEQRKTVPASRTLLGQ